MSFQSDAKGYDQPFTIPATDAIGSTTRTTTYGYDIENRVTSVATPEGTINYGYDSIGRHNETWTTNSDIWYGYDPLSRVWTVTVKKQNGQTLTPWLVITYYYTKVGNIDHVTYANGTETDYGYDPLNRLTSVTNKVTAGNTLSSYSYTLNADGLRTGVTETDNLPSTVTKTWTYDNLQRLTGEAVVSNVSGQSYTDTYSYDLVGNRLSKTDVVGIGTTTTTVTTDTFNADDQLTSETGTVNSSSSWSTSFQYDLNGSLTNVTRTGAGAETDQYGYDLQKRLSSANISRTENGQGVTITATYSYDDSGYRAYGSVTVNGTTTTTNYLTDTNNPTGYTQVLEEHTGSSGTLSMSYVIGLTVLGQTPASGGTSLLMPDGQGSTRLLVGPTGTIAARYQYDAYGNVLGVAIGVLSPPATKILYTGQLFEPTLLQYQLRARYYDPATGRFTQLDSFAGDHFRPASLHKYLYSSADPVDRVDPTGHLDLIELTISIGQQIGLFAIRHPYLFNCGLGAALGIGDAVIRHAGGWEIAYTAGFACAIGLGMTPLMQIMYLRAIAAGIGLAFGIIGTYQAYLEDDLALALYRGSVTMIGGVFIFASSWKYYFGAPATRTVNPATLRWSQTTAGGGGRGAQILASLKKDGWQGPPIDVVETPEGLVAIDNTRAAAALKLGMKVPVRVHEPSEPLPTEMIEGPDGPRFTLDSNQNVYAKTWGEAAAIRATNQQPPLPPEGSTTPPRLMGVDEE